ncbi:MAG: hypothetical protein CMM44_11595 [Rhodospirillaceae bacterium]|nr:hypothetical protein [Rhodospirillaceae bacterium]|tara:strand:- start:1500 stop:2177 length:678 start_codon:yes stop_codon:yes gene_type:complete
MIVASIMQPTYLPWIGYFKLIENSDIFIFLDCVQFDKRSWQQRNYIRNDDNKLLLSVPVHTKGKFNQAIKNVKIDYSINWQNKHLNTLFHCYSKTRYFDDHYFDLKNILIQNTENISSLNIKLIKMICNKLKIKTKFIVSSYFSLDFNKDELLYNLCKEVNANLYLSPPGSKKYLSESNYFNKDIKLKYFEYKKYFYNQKGKNFIENLSVVDFIFNNDLKDFKFL